MRRITDLAILSTLALCSIHCSGTLQVPDNGQGGANNAPESAGTPGSTNTNVGNGGSATGNSTGNTTPPAPSTGGTGGEAMVPVMGLGGDGGSSAVNNPAANPMGAGDLPCDVQTLLATRCQACHIQTPPGKMLSHDDLMQPSRSDPTKTVGQLALVRMQATGITHMPPTPMPAATPDEIAAFSAWLDQGAPANACGAPSAPAMNPYDTPTVCTSNTNWTGGNHESPLMRPGGACISCHTMSNEGPPFSLAGTLFPTPHEPNDCNGFDGTSTTDGAQIVITDANGMEYMLTPNAVGNFSSQAAVALPYNAKVVYQGRERAMLAAQNSGDCNSCHTEAGTTTLMGTANAPGRIFLP